MKTCVMSSFSLKLIWKNIFLQIWAPDRLPERATPTLLWVNTLNLQSLSTNYDYYCSPIFCDNPNNRWLVVEVTPKVSKPTAHSSQSDLLGETPNWLTSTLFCLDNANSVKHWLSYVFVMLKRLSRDTAHHINSGIRTSELNCFKQMSYMIVINQSIQWVRKDQAEAQSPRTADNSELDSQWGTGQRNQWGRPWQASAAKRAMLP